MANHKKHPNKNRRAGCKLCKPWKISGVKKHTKVNEQFSSFVLWDKAGEEIKNYDRIQISET